MKAEMWDVRGRNRKTIPHGGTDNSGRSGLNHSYDVLLTLYSSAHFFIHDFCSHPILQHFISKASNLFLFFFFSVHVSLAYITTLITVAFNMFILVPVLIFLLLQIFPNCSIAPVALAILL